MTIRSPFDESSDDTIPAPMGTAGARKSPRRPTIELAERRNRFVAAISDAVLILHAAPGGKLDRLADELLSAGKLVATLQDRANQPLIEKGAYPILADAGSIQSLLTMR